jgi:triphosphoribosyl-dephospho-CoA synthase
MAYPKGPERFSKGCLDALLMSISKLEDSCLLARGGTLGLAIAQQGADEIVRLGGSSSRAGRRALLELNDVLVRAGLSPGGSADMVAAGIFLVTAESCLAATQARQPQEMPHRWIA